MKVSSFLALYNVRMKDVKDIKEDLIIQTITDLIKPVKYISYDDKLKLIDGVLDKDTNSKHLTADRHRNFMIALLSAYTNLEVDKNGYDLLCETRLLDYILATFKSECEFITKLLNMCLRDESMVM